MNGRAIVLAVDDDEAILEVVEWALEDEGYQVVRAMDGAEALEILSRIRPALILLDMRMPGMNGWEFAAAYEKLNGGRAPLVVMTAAHDAAQLAAEVKANDYIGKPFDVDKLVETVRRNANAKGA